MSKNTSPFFVSETVRVSQPKMERFYDGIKIIDAVEKTGNGEDDYIVVKKVIHEKTPCRKVIQADKDTVGVYNIISQVMRTGDTSLLPVDKGGEVDLVGAPESLMEVKQAGVKAEAMFEALPEELTKGLDMSSFVNSMSQEKFDEFIQAVLERQQKEKEVKTDE